MDNEAKVEMLYFLGSVQFLTINSNRPLTTYTSSHCPSGHIVRYFSCRISFLTHFSQLKKTNSNKTWPAFAVADVLSLENSHTLEGWGWAVFRIDTRFYLVHDDDDHNDYIPLASVPDPPFLSLDARE